MIAVREATIGDAVALAKVEVATWRDSYAALLPERWLVRQLDARRAALSWRRRLSPPSPNKVLVAADRLSGIVGYAVFGPSRLGALPFANELYELYLLSDFQGRGLGRRLCGAVADRLLRTGTASLCVEVLEGNPSRFFYEALGARLAARAERRFAGTGLPSLVYGWDDMTVLVGARQG